MIVMQKIVPIMRCAMRNSQPKKMIQRILNSNPPTPKLPSSIFFPKGHNTNVEILKHWRPKGIPIIVRHKKSPMVNHAKAEIIPPNNSQIIFPIKFIISSPSLSMSPTNEQRIASKLW